MNKFDKPYRLVQIYDQKKVIELFNIVNNLDTNELLQYSLNNQISFDVIYDDNGDSLIHAVIKIDNRKTNQLSKLNIIKFLFQNGASPDIPNKMNQTPLHLACNYQLDIIVKYLLSINVNPNYTDNLGHYPFHYLFFGKIKLSPNTTKVLDFIEPPRENKTDFLNKKEIIEIKQKIWQIIKDKPFLIAIKNTINKLIEKDQINFDFLYESLDIQKDPNLKKPSDFIYNIFSFNSKITESIKAQFSKFPDLKDYSSFDYNKKIKELIKKKIDDIQNINIMIGGKNDNPGDINQEDQLKNKNIYAIDNASSIYNFENNIYLAGSRTIYIDEFIGNPNNDLNLFRTNIYNNFDAVYPQWDPLLDGLNLIEQNIKTDRDNFLKEKDPATKAGHEKSYDQNLNVYYNLLKNKKIDKFENKININNVFNPIKNVQELLKITEDNKRIFYLLTNDKTEYPAYNIIQTKLDNLTTQSVGECIEEIFKWFGGVNKSGYDKTFLNNKKLFIYTMNYSLFILMSFVAIIKPKNMNELKSGLMFDDINKENEYFHKWYKKLFEEKNIDLGLCIYGMYCDLQCYAYSNDNLICSVPFNLIALVNGLKNNDLTQGIINVYKPHLIHKLIDDLDIKNRIQKCLILFLNDNIDNKFFTNLIGPTTSIPKINDEVDCFIELINYYLINRPNNDEIMKEPDSRHILLYKTNYENYKNKYNRIKPVNVFQEIIKSIYNNLVNKPLLQNMNDLVYFIGLLDNPKNDMIFKNISIINFIEGTKIILPKTDQPSIFNIKINNDETHFIISHIMGLYYLGKLQKIDCKEDNDKFKNNIGKNKKLDIQYINYPEIEVLTDRYRLNQIYNTSESYIPSDENYENTINKIIESYNSKINTNLISIIKVLEDLKIGKITNYSKIYTEYYININKIYSLYNIVSSLITNPTKIVNIKNISSNINSINALLYIYYYLKDESNKVKLSKFNYYLLDDFIDYHYYENEDEDELELMKGGANIYDIENQIYREVTKYVSEDIDKIYSLPPSLYKDLGKFYEFGLIKLLKDILESNSEPENDILNYLKRNKNINLKNERNVTLTKLIIAKIIEETIKQDINIYINNKTIEHTKSIQNIDSDQTLFKTKDMSINLVSTSIDVEKFIFYNDITSIKNIYSVIKKEENNDEFIIYQNDFSNTTRLKIKNYFYVKEDIIDILLDSHSFLFNTNLDDIIPIHSLLKIYNNKLINNLSLKLKNNNIELCENVGHNSINFIKQECKNNLNKVLNKYDDNNIPVINVFKNINDNLFNDVKLLITSNESFCNNVLEYLENSFNICSYLTIQYLSEHLTNIDIQYTFDDAKNIFNLFNYDINDIINKNYLGEIIEDLKISDNDDIFIAEQFLKDKKSELKINDHNMKKIQRSLDKLNDNLKMQDKMKKTTEFDKVEMKNKELCKEIKLLNKIIQNNGVRDIIKKKDNNNKSLIESYEYNTISINTIWNELLNMKLEGNFNLILIDILLKQKEYLENNEQNIFDKGLNHISILCEKYFEDDSYTDVNKPLEFINEMLEYLTRIIICNSIEYMMRRILYNYFYNSSVDNNYESINIKITYIINSEIVEINKSIKDILFDNISIRLVKSVVGIFRNKNEENLYTNETIRDILSEFFDHLKVFDNMISENILNIFSSNVVSYFDSFTSRTILLWMVNIENIFKFFINNYRSNNILLLLSGSSNNVDDIASDSDITCSDSEIDFKDKPGKNIYSDRPELKDKKFIQFIKPVFDDNITRPWDTTSNTFFIKLKIKPDTNLVKYYKANLNDQFMKDPHLTLYNIYIPTNGTIEKYIKSNTDNISEYIINELKKLDNQILNPITIPSLYHDFGKFHVIEYDNSNINDIINTFRKDLINKILKDNNITAHTEIKPPVHTGTGKQLLNFTYYIDNNTNESLFAIDDNYTNDIKPHISIIRNTSSKIGNLSSLNPSNDTIQINLLNDVEIDILYAYTSIL